MAFFAVLGFILLLGLFGKKPSRGSYVVVALVAVGASVYEYLQ